jgi:hypothetical protein
MILAPSTRGLTLNRPVPKFCVESEVGVAYRSP